MSRVNAAILAGVLVASCQEAARLSTDTPAEESNDQPPRRATARLRRIRLAVGMVLALGGAWIFPARLLAEDRPPPPRYLGECYLSELPPVQSDAVARMLISECRARFKPMPTYEKPAETFHHAIDCIRAKALSTDSELAAEKIVAACNKLYGTT